MCNFFLVLGQNVPSLHEQLKSNFHNSFLNDVKSKNNPLNALQIVWVVVFTIRTFELNFTHYEIKKKGSIQFRKSITGTISIESVG